MLSLFDPQPPSCELPERFPSPFDASTPHPLARRAADRLQAHLRDGLARRLELDTDGKMFGVLVVARSDGKLGFLRAFSGMAGGSWEVEGFAPPLFDLEKRDAFWPAGERELAEIAARMREIEQRAQPMRTALAELTAQHEAASSELRDRHRANRQLRHESRAQLVAAKLVDDDRRAALHALDQESRADTAEGRRHDASRRAAREQLAWELRFLDDEQAALEHVRAECSRKYLHAIHDTYAIASARGEHRSLRSLFAPNEPPGGAGDCAAPKLLGSAYRQGLRPIALLEFWWGAPPVTGGRTTGVYYPACRGKCGPILAHMLDGLAAEPAPVFGNTPIAADEPRTVFEDDWLVVVAKPDGLLSVPGRGGQLHDSVLARLRRRYPRASGPLVVHRLDLDTSGLLLVAKDETTHTALQRLFARREVTKRYIAWLDGDVVGDSGVIELPLRVDLDDRPRQIVDPVHGKAAITEWRVLERTGTRTKVAMFPRTGRSHQLRVHAAHERGLGAPIVGDRLYGKPDARLMLHAEALTFVHPHTQVQVMLERPAPF
ncbi:MAG: Ribosomal large subunit pseudouridine synthase [Myxococcales bacterium]|nr:Ribosomal large subunit pseudouridine synthase [Myxococcales bacterium]